MTPVHGRNRGWLLLPAAALYVVAAVADGDLDQRYRRASDFVPWRISNWLTMHETHRARWSENGREFAYTSTGPEGERLWIGDARTGRVRAAPPDQRMPGPAATTLGPHGRVGIGVEGFNLWLVDARTGMRKALTGDGRADNSYSALYEFGVLLDVERQQLRGPMRAAQGLWSPDGRYFATFRYDQRGVGSVIYTKAVTDRGYGARGEYIEQKSAFPGEPNAHAVLVLCDTVTGAVREVPQARFETFLDPFTAGLVQWSSQAGILHVLLEGRGLRSASVLRVDAASGVVGHRYEEFSDTYLMLSGARYPAIWSVLEDGRRMLWYSERDGWGNLYLVDLETGRVLHPVTRGEGVVQRLLRVDEKTGWVYFVASGRDPGVDPYFRQAFRARLDGSRVQSLTPEPADHVISMPASGTRFLDLQSAGVASPPVTVLRTLEGREVAKVAATDTVPLRARGWRPPERARVRSANGRYDVYVTVFKPSDFDPAKRYPVLDYVYGLSSLALTPWSFPAGPGFEKFDSYWHSTAIAELGFIVVKLDAPGTPLRGHRFARESYGEGHVGAMLDDHVAALRQLAARESSFDLDRVGIFGSSGGGYTSTRAMLLRPDFFKVAVAFSGSHDLLRLYGPEWGDRYIGPFESNRELYERMSNTAYADRLRGKLLLVHGEADSEVNPLMTQQFVHSLIAANRDFDLLYVPGAEHDLDANAYAVRRRWDYFVRNLTDREPPRDFAIPPPAGR